MSNLTHKVDVLPRGPVTDDTELVVINGRVFINAAKHEELLVRHVTTAVHLAAKLDQIVAYIEEHRRVYGHDRVVGEEVLREARVDPNTHDPRTRRPA